MELLKSLITRDDECMFAEDEERTPKQKRVIPIEEGTNLGLNLQDDYFEVETIKRRPLPREDGRQWSFMEQTTVAEAKRPYGKQYLEERAERQRLLSHNKDYRFANELAGALRKELSDIIDPEDAARMAQERERERVETEIELKRTRLDMDKKYELVQKLKSMLTEERAQQKTLGVAQAPYDLRISSRYLVDNELLPATVAQQSTGFLDLLSLHDTYAEGEGRIAEREKLVLEELSGDELNEKSEEWLDLFFYVYVYYRDFLDNASDHSFRESFTPKLYYALDNLGSFAPTVKKESGATTAQGYEGRLDEIGLDGEQNPLRALDAFEETNSPVVAVDWPRYKKQHTETINMNYFEKMGISSELERAMAAQGATERYKERYPLYYAKVLAYLYGTAEEKNNALIGTGGLLLSRDEKEDPGGNPLAISALIQIQFPNYKQDAPLGAIAELLRSHFLWLYFEETPWAEITTQLMVEQTIIVGGIREVIKDLEPILATTLSLYKVLLLEYLIGVAQFMVGVLQLTPRMEALLKQPFDDRDLSSYVRHFDALNNLFKGVDVRDLIKDELFFNYLSVGSKAFAERQFGRDLFDEGGGGVTQPANLVVVAKEYPILLLHRLFRAYAAYLGEYSTLAADNVTRLVAAIEKANRKIADVVGDESYVLNSGAEYRQRKSFTTLPENSGFIKMRAEIVYLLRQAYNLVKDYCPGLRMLPLEGYQSDSAYETGLSTDFIGVVAVLAADREFTFPDGYRSGKQFTKIKQDKQGMMRRLRRYCWQGGNGRPYVIIKDRDGDIGLRPFFADNVGGRMMF